jgi:hypothetical protein
MEDSARQRDPFGRMVSTRIMHEPPARTISKISLRRLVHNAG